MVSGGPWLLRGNTDVLIVGGVPGLESRPLYTLSKRSTAELHTTQSESYVMLFLGEEY